MDDASITVNSMTGAIKLGWTRATAMQLRELADRIDPPLNGAEISKTTRAELAPFSAGVLRAEIATRHREDAALLGEETP